MSLAMDGGGGTGGAAITSSSSISPGRSDVPSVIGRLLQRTASTTRKSRRFRKSTGTAFELKELLLNEVDEDQLPLDPGGSRTPEVAARRRSRSTATDAADITQPQPQQFHVKPTATLRAEMPSATPQPGLKKKASFRDRLKVKAWQKPPQHLEIVTEESRPRFVYEPKHAAADFSQLAVSPVSPPRQRSPPLQASTSQEAPIHRASNRRSRDQTEARRSRQEDELGRRQSKPGTYNLTEDPFHASNTAVHIPVNSRPVAWSPGVQSAPGDDQPTLTSQQLSDYELFIARAEEEDRERRELILRSISQRSAAYAAPRVKPDPHRQFAAAGRSSAERSDGSQQRNTGRYVLGSSAVLQQEHQQPSPPTQREHNPRAAKGHARQQSWAASYASTSTAAENGLERTRSPASPQAQPRRTPKPAVAPQPVVYGDDDEHDDFSKARAYQPHPPRALRRQASFTQRIVEYIRPAKIQAARPIATVVE